MSGYARPAVSSLVHAVGRRPSGFVVGARMKMQVVNAKNGQMNFPAFTTLEFGGAATGVSLALAGALTSDTGDFGGSDPFGPLAQSSKGHFLA